MTKPAKPTKPKPSTWIILRNRVIAGLFVVLPFVITGWVIIQLYTFLFEYLVGPTSDWLLERWFPAQKNLPWWLKFVVGPTAAIAMITGLLFVAGMFLNSRILRFVDWFLNNVPGINLIYSVVSNVFTAVQRSRFDSNEFQRAVLVEFPHPGMKVPAFVTSETKDETTGHVILCVYVPTTPVPTSGYMLLVPESKVVPLDWDLQDTLQAIVSGGITTPKLVKYYPKDI